MIMLTPQARASAPAIPHRMETDPVLGARYSKERTEFLVWAPSATKVQLRLYRAGSAEESAEPELTLSMYPEDNGLYALAVPGDMNGAYYTYLITGKDGEVSESADPWAVACGVNGNRSMVLDLRSTDPSGWEQDVRPQRYAAAPIIWEAHVRDFSSDPASGVRKEWQGKYLGFTEPNTTLENNGTTPTCLNYLKKLGITHVQLQPIADYCTVDERTGRDYNWGYDIANYNVPEGSYATDPFHGAVRVRECKQMIQALHKAGIGVVLDVVYNHTYYSKGSWLSKTAPGQYYRHRADGHFYNASGCGCETACERWPFQNYMLQSVLYWAQEYHVDGFRFDLMGIHDVDTMNLIRSALDRLPGGRRILMYGEPWAALPPSIEPPAIPASKENIMALNDRIGVFSDATRDTVAGPAFDPWTGNYSAGHMQPWMVRSVQSSVRGWSSPELDHYMSSPTQCVHYASAHDNYTLWDREIMQRDSRDYDGRQPAAEARQRVVSGIIFTCSGPTFLQGGEEFLRTKHGQGNTYNGPAEENMLHWQLAARNNLMVDWYRGLIELHHAMVHTAHPSPETAAQVTFMNVPDGAVAYTVPAWPGSGWIELLVCYNPRHKDIMITLPKGTWHLVCDGARSDLRGEICRKGHGEIIIPMVSVMIFAK